MPPWLRPAEGLRSNQGCVLPKVCANFLSPEDQGTGHGGSRTADPRSGRAQPGKGRSRDFSLWFLPFSAQLTRKLGADVKVLRSPENSGGKKSPISPLIIFQAFTSLNILTMISFNKNETCIMHHTFLKYPNDFILVKDA